MAYPTNPIYKFITDPITGVDDHVKKQIGNTIFSIPFDEENIDYQEYLEWAKTNTAEAAD